MEKEKNVFLHLRKVLIVVLILTALFFTFESFAYYSFDNSLNSISLKNNSSLNSGNVVVTMKHPPFVRPLSFILDGVNITDRVEYSSGEARFLLSGLSDGRHRLFVGFIGDFNPITIASNYRYVNFEVDRTPPKIIIDTPSGDIVRTDLVYVTGRTDPEAALLFAIGDHTFKLKAEKNGQFYKEIPIDKEVNVLKITSTDRAGNKSYFKKKLILDRFPPSITIKSPLPNQELETNENIISIEVSDTGSGISECYLIVDGKRVDGTLDRGKSTFSVNMKNMDEGLYDIKAVVWDRAGWKDEKRWSFLVNSLEEPGSTRIRPGAKGEDVKLVQRLLVKQGLLTEAQVTGLYDSVTTAAVIAQQERNKITPTGIMDNETLMTISNKIYIYLDEFTLVLVSPEGQVVKRYPIACGSPYFPTPTGSYHVKEKIYYPAWYPPPSPWASGAKPIPPGPYNPLGTRWIGLDANIVGIHGTPSDWSIGSASSHGCIRMHIPDVEELYDLVNIGTPVYIYAARPEEHKKYKAENVYRNYNEGFKSGHMAGFPDPAAQFVSRL